MLLIVYPTGGIHIPEEESENESESDESADECDDSDAECWQNLTMLGDNNMDNFFICDFIASSLY